MGSIKEQIVQELHKPARRVFKRRSVLLKGIDDLWQADLVEMIPYAGSNKGYKYLLTVIDCFSKYAWVVPIKNKTASVVCHGFEKILSERKPKNLQTDNGKEFYNKVFQNLMKTMDINHYSTFSNLKASIIERFNRTLKSAMWKQFSLQGNYNWLSILQILVDKYNKRKHSTIKMAPASVHGIKIETHLLQDVYSKKISSKNAVKFRVGDYVRISKYKAQFAKGYQPSWSTEIFTVAEVRKTVPVTYHLKDDRGEVIAGGFYQEELQLVKHPDCYLVERVVKRKGNKALVKWLGFDSSHNSWVGIKHLNI